MKYKVLETYTPDDPQEDRDRRTAEFESDSTDIMELAFLARLACQVGPVSEAMKEGVRIRLRESEVAEQLADQETSGFEFLLFGNCGEWCLEVEEVS